MSLPQQQFGADEARLSPADLRHMRRSFERRKTAEKAQTKIEKKIKLKD